MIAEAIFTGTELLLGQTLNTNSQILQQELAELGIDLYFQITVGDNLERCATALLQAADRSDLIIMGGGLGPTEDDLSREALAHALHLDLVKDEAAAQVMSRYFRQKGIPISVKNEKQSLIPTGGEILDNPIGTAPGIWLATELQGRSKIFALLPGPPHEFQKMLQKVLRPKLEQVLGEHHSHLDYKVLRFCGIGESNLDEQLSDLLKSTNPTVAPTAKAAEVHLRIAAKANEKDQIQALIAEMEQKIRQRVGQYIYGTNEQTLAQVVGQLLQQKNLTLALHEDFTAGLLASELAVLPEAADFWRGGTVKTLNPPPWEADLILNVGSGQINPNSGVCEIDLTLQDAATKKEKLRIWGNTPQLAARQILAWFWQQLNKA